MTKDRKERVSNAQAYALRRRREFAIRCAAFAGGVVINSFGIEFITKAALGTSPIS